MSLRTGGVTRSVWRLAGPHRGVLARSVGWKAAAAVAQAIPVGVVVAVVERVRVGTLDADDLGWSLAVIAACIVAQWVCGYLANRSAWIATFEMFGDLRIRGLDHLRRLPMGFLTSRRSGDTATALTTDVMAVESFTHEPFQMLVGAMTAPIVVFVLLLVQDVPMAFATAISVVLSAPAFWWANRTFTSLAAVRQQRQADAAGRMVEYVNGLPVIRAFRVTGERLGEFRRAMDDYRAINTKLVVKLAPVGMAYMAVVLLGIPCVLFFGALWLFDGTIDAGTLIVFSVLVLRVYQPLLAAAEAFEGLRIADASIDRIADVFDEPEQPVPPSPTATPDGYSIELDRVDFGYSDAVEVLHDVSLHAEPATLTAIVGPSGAGKSTILDLMARFYDPQHGIVRIGGVDVRALTAEQLFDAVTVVFQDTYLFPGTIRDNIAFGRPGTSEIDVERAARAAQAHDFVSALPSGYDTPVAEAGTSLSGGERQRIAIARAILKDAPIVLLDEATSAIDPTNERMVQSALGELVRAKTVVVVAHRLATIRSADQIVVLDDGRVVGCGRHDDLIADCGAYRRLWDARRRAETWRLRR